MDIQINNQTLHLTFKTPRLEATSVPRLKKTLHGMGEIDCTQVKADMSAVEFLDSSGIGLLLEIHNRFAEPSGTKLTLIGAQPEQLSVLKLLRLDGVFNVAQAA